MTFQAREPFRLRTLIATQSKEVSNVMTEEHQRSGYPLVNRTCDTIPSTQKKALLISKYVQAMSLRSGWEVATRMQPKAEFVGT